MYNFRVAFFWAGNCNGRLNIKAYWMHMAVLRTASLAALAVLLVK